MPATSPVRRNDVDPISAHGKPITTPGLTLPTVYKSDVAKETVIDADIHNNRGRIQV